MRKGGRDGLGKGQKDNDGGRWREPGGSEGTREGEGAGGGCGDENIMAG